jgi:hypothetical protein
VDGDSGILAITSTAGAVYVGGDFSRLARPDHSAFAVFRRGSVHPAASVAGSDDWSVDGVVADGAGGWFVGGGFDSFGGVGCRHLVHVLASGRVDPRWCPRPRRVAGLARRGRTLFAITYGYFRGSGAVHSTVVGFDARTGRRLPGFRLRLGGSETIYPPNVWAVAASGRLVFLGGGFASVDGRPGKRLAAVDARTGRWVWGATVRDGRVSGVFVVGRRLFAVGRFDSVDGQPRDRLAVLDAATGQLLSSPAPLGRHRVAAMAVSGSRVVISYERKRGFRADTLVALSASGGRILWRRSDDAKPLAFFGSDLLVERGRDVAALDAATGRPRRWRIRPDTLPAVAAVSGRRVALGGRFRSVGPGVSRLGLAAVDAESGEVLPWRADVNVLASQNGRFYNTVSALAANDQALYVAGTFTGVGGRARDGLAAVDLRSGQTLAWKPPATFSCSWSDDCTLVATATVVYVLSSSASISVHGRARGAVAFDATTGAVLPWTPAPDNAIDSLALDGPIVYIGGLFAHVRGAARPYLAAVDATSGTATAWTPQPDGDVTALAVAGTTLFVGGAFQHIGPVERDHLAAFDTTTGALLPWNPGASGFFRYVSELAVVGSTVYVAGQPANGHTRGLIALDATTGAELRWPTAPSLIERFVATPAGLYATETYGYSTSLLVPIQLP